MKAWFLSFMYTAVLFFYAKKKMFVFEPFGISIRTYLN